MAGEDKSKSKNVSKGGDMTPLVIVVIITFFLFFVGFSTSFENSLNKFNQSIHDKFDINFALIGNIAYIILSILSIFFIFLISYCVIRMYEVRKKEHEHLKHEIAEYAHHMAEKESKLKDGQSSSRNDLWNNILRHLLSSTPSDWKLAILEADEMLDNLLGQLGFRGENLGEKLKTIDREKFRGLAAAWEVHLVRNRVAHEGSNFELSEREVKRIIALYEQIFREFNYI